MQLRARWRRPVNILAVSGAMAVSGLALATPAGAAQSFLGHLSTIRQVATTVPASTPVRPGDGDLNPYGVAVVTHTTGRLVRGDVLVSNFNNGANQQGRGRTIVEISKSGAVRAFARVPEVPGGVGLTTALAVLPDGFVAVGNLPARDGTAATARPGGLLILNRNGTLVSNITGRHLNGPWDLASVNYGDRAVLYITNVLNGTVAAHGAVVHRGTVVRLVVDLRSGSPTVVSDTVVGSGFAEHSDPAALVVGPTGVGIGRNGTLYVADTVNSTIRAIPNADLRTTSAGLGQQVTASSGALNGPLGLVIAPNGDIVTVNAGDGRAVETTPRGVQVATKTLDTSGQPAGSGALFGLAVAPANNGIYFVDDATNTLNLLH